MGGTGGSAGRLLRPCLAASAEWATLCGGCVEVLPDLGDGFAAVECLAGGVFTTSTRPTSSELNLLLLLRAPV